MKENLEDNVIRQYFQWAGDNEPEVPVAYIETVEEQDFDIPEVQCFVSVEVPDWKQNDRRWADIPYGPNDSWTTYAQAGCGCLSYAMVLEAYGLYDETTLPEVKDKVLAVGRLAYKKGYRKKNKGTSSGLFSVMTDVERTKDIDDVFEAIDEGYPVILLVRYGWSTYKGSGHYVVCKGYSTDKTTLMINDPATSSISRSRVKIKGNWNSVAYAYICKPYITQLK